MSTYYYAVVTFGLPAARSGRCFQSKARAIAAANAAKGAGSCCAAHVIRCNNRALAESADISRLRPGERTVYVA